MCFCFWLAAQYHHCVRDRGCYCHANIQSNIVALKFVLFFWVAHVYLHMQ